MVYVKICGVTAPEHVEVAVEAGADMIGLMFVEASRRRVTVEQARRLTAVLPPRKDEPALALALPAGHAGALWFERCAVALERRIGERRPLLVGVFADQPLTLVNSIADAAGLDLVQLSGHETWEQALAVRRPVIKAERVEPGDLPGDIITRAEAGTASMVMLDAAVPGQLGGTGATFDWETGRGVAATLPVVLAGGLTPENVSEAIAAVRPWGVDVSSGVETAGVKDVEKIAAFVRAVRATAGVTEGASRARWTTSPGRRPETLDD